MGAGMTGEGGNDGGNRKGLPNGMTSPVTTTPTHTPPATDQQTLARAMRRAVDLARAVRGRTSPLPPVGAVVVQGERVVGEGATDPPGGPHAEAKALGPRRASGPGAARSW